MFIGKFKNQTFHVVGRIRSNDAPGIASSPRRTAAVASYSRLEEGVTAGSCRITVYLQNGISDDLGLLASSQSGIQHELDRSSAARDRAGMKISTKNTEVICRSTNPRQCMLQVRGNPLQQVEKFKYLGVVFVNDGRWSEEIDRWIRQANAVLCELYRSAVKQ